LASLQGQTGVAACLGVLAGDNLGYIAEVGSDTLTMFAARSNIRAPLLATGWQSAPGRFSRA